MANLAALDLFQRVFQHERTAVRVADEHQRLAGTDRSRTWRTPRRTAASQSSQTAVVSAGRHGAVPGHPQRQTVVAARLYVSPTARMLYGESVRP